MEPENGIVIGIVDSLDDPEKCGRVQLRFPHLKDELSNWARLASPMAGKDRGFFLCPERGDEVLVAFEHGDPRRPYVVGSCWGTADTPPPNDGDAVSNNWRFFRSRSGHLLKFDDTSGSERIEITGKGGDHQIVVDVSGKKIEIHCSSGDVALTAPSGKVSIEANEVEIKAKGSMTLEAQGSMTVKGSTVAIN